MKPFRWNLKKVEQLGRLLEGQAQKDYRKFTEELAQCAALVVARSENKKIVFVGRSPENIFDYLSGIFLSTSYEDRCSILNISNRFYEIEDIKNQLPESYWSLKNHFNELGLNPKDIIHNENGVCFVDLVAWGGTFQNIFMFLKGWAEEQKEDVPALITKLGFLGITQRSKNSPNTWRWQQRVIWLQAHPQLSIKNISISVRLWDYLGNRQNKVSDTNYPERWQDNKIMQPPREEDNLEALRQAYDIFCLAQSEKQCFAKIIAGTQEIKQAWLRSLVNELKRSKHV